MTRKFNIIPLKNRRRKLRQDSTLAETILWNEIRNKKLGARFIRQYSVAGYVIDFYCPRQKIGIELEGGIHNKRDVKIYDDYRKRYIQQFGIKLLFFTNDEITNDLNNVLKSISLSFLKRGTKGEL